MHTYSHMHTYGSVHRVLQLHRNILIENSLTPQVTDPLVLKKHIPPSLTRTHTHIQVSVSQMKLPFKVTAQSTAAQFWPRTLHSFQIGSVWSHCSVCAWAHMSYTCMCVCVYVCACVCRPERKGPFAGDVCGICAPQHGAVSCVTFHPHPANTVACPLIRWNTHSHTHSHTPGKLVRLLFLVTLLTSLHTSSSTEVWKKNVIITCMAVNAMLCKTKPCTINNRKNIKTHNKF